MARGHGCVASALASATVCASRLLWRRGKLLPPSQPTRPIRKCVRLDRNPATNPLRAQGLAPIHGQLWVKIDNAPLRLSASPCLFLVTSGLAGMPRKGCDVCVEGYLMGSVLPSQPFRATTTSQAGDVSHAQIPPPATRLYDIFAQRPDGTAMHKQVQAPAQPLFDRAFAAFGRGTVLQAASGEISIEDLRPGDLLHTTSGLTARVMWIGTGSFPPAAEQQTVRLFRVMADAFGQSRPAASLTLGQYARLLQSPVHLSHHTNTVPTLTPVSEFADGMQVIEVTPPSAVDLFHMVLDRHAAVKANGLEVESFHPGVQALRALPERSRMRFLAMFPHIQTPADFGPLAHPRTEERDPELVAAGYL